MFNKSEDKVYRLGLKDNVHRISDLDNDSMLPLYHIVVVLILSVWDNKTGGSVEPEVINLTLLNELATTNNLNNNYTKYILTIN